MLAKKFLEIITNTHEELSQDADASVIQEGCSILNVLISREISCILIDENGRVQAEFLPEVIDLVKKNLYSVTPMALHDAKRREHILKVLTLLNEDKSLRLALQRVGKPHMHRVAEDVIRSTLALSSKTHITDAHARRAALSAWLCYLRQNVGSCFATAPAILVHDEQPEQFLNDLSELLSTGRLKRTFGGKEYSVPFSSSWGAGDLKRTIPSGADIHRSPGLRAARESVGLDQLEKFSTPEQMIRKGLLKKFEITENDLKEYEMRPKGELHGTFLVQTLPSEGGIGGKCHHFLQEFEIAKNAFKSLSDNALLKAWEFSIASFAETKFQFTSWNLYSSLGLGPHDEGGIGPCLYDILKRKLEESNRQVQEYQLEYEQLLSQVQYLQRRVQRSDSEKSAQWARAEYQTKLNEFRLQEELRDKAHFKAKRYANLFNDLVELYYSLFPDYFQEVYDADIHEVTAAPYDDSPAGFRLVYKHGRSNTSQWTKIENHVEFIDALVSFFTASEVELESAPEMEGLEDDLSEIVTSIVTHIRSEEFLETAFDRMAKTHHTRPIKNPLENLDKIEKKPWVYTSGGAMTTLVSNYFKREEKPTDVSRWVEDPTELLVFFLDSLKQAPEPAPNRSLLAHSPTHAFLVKPLYTPFCEGWQNQEFTYTWVRDHWVKKMENFFYEMYLDEDKIQYLVKKIHEKVPPNYKPAFNEVFGGMRGAMHIKDFRNHVADTIAVTQGLKYHGFPVISDEQIDSILYESLPIFPGYQLQERVEAIVSDLSGVDKQACLNLLDQRKVVSVVGAKDLIFIVLNLIRLSLETMMSSHNFLEKIVKIAREKGYLPPLPIIFADTNWVKDDFAFLVNPGTLKLELWRCDPYGITGAPMRIWDEWLNGTKKEPAWGLYIKPDEYLA